MAEVERNTHVSRSRRLVYESVIELLATPESNLRNWVSSKFVQMREEDHALIFELSTIVTGAELEDEYERDLAAFWAERGEAGEAEETQREARGEAGETQREDDELEG